MNTTPRKRVPCRWEWRTFAASLTDLQVRIGTAANVPAHDSSEVYLLGARDDLNLKIRNGALDLKCLETTNAAGLELWRPSGQISFPAPGEKIAELLAPFGLGLSLEEPTTLKTFLERISENGQLQITNVAKSRRSFAYMGCLAEFTRIMTNGQTVESFCIESKNPQMVLDALRELDLTPTANIGFPRGLRQQLGSAHRTAKPEIRGKVEIERKFLVDARTWRPSVPGAEFRQGYLSSVKERVVRVRIAGNKGWLTVKGVSVGITRTEFEYEIPVTDASFLLENLCERPIIAKTRYREQVGDRVWEVDVFHGENEGLVVAELELRSEDERFDKPAWATRDVSDDPKYFNNSLIAKPYKNWPPEDR